jgi:hypothetical protein
MIKFESLEINTKAESEGEWVPVKRWYGLDPDLPYSVTELPGLEFHVKSINDPAYRVAHQKMIEELEIQKKSYPDEIVPDEIVDGLEGKLIADRLLLSWKGFDIDYSADVARAALQKSSARTIRQMILSCAAKVGKKKVEFVTAEVDNLGKPQAGNSDPR